jgi:integrase
LLQFGNKFLNQERFSLSTVRSRLTPPSIPTRKRLTALSIPTRKDGRHLDEQVKGLYLEVTRDGTSRRWLLRFVSPQTHRPTEAGLGTWPTVSLADARAKASEYRSLIAKGTDPIHARREARAESIAARKASTTFGSALDAYVDAFEDKGAPTIELEALLRRHVAQLLPRPLATVTSNDVLAALQATQAKLPKTAARARAAVSIVFDYAVAKGMFNGANPARASVFKFLLPAPPRSTPHRMMPFHDVPAFFARLSEVASPSRLCLAFLILTGARSQEAIKATWAEIDMSQGLWVIPAERMKKRRVHKVPLSTPAMALLEQARDMFMSDRFVFPGMTRGSPLNPRALQCALQKQLCEPYAIHGFRASFSTWAHERTEFPHETIELALAHVEGQGNAVTRAYNRSDAIEKRRVLMQMWGDYVTGASSASNVLLFAAQAQI